MYGTIARMQLKPGMLDKMREFGHEISAELAPAGFLWEHVFQADGNENEVWLVVAFKDREAYQKNASDPAQNQRYMQMRSMLAADPEWHDGEIVDSYPR